MTPKGTAHKAKRCITPATRRHVKTKPSQSTESSQRLTEDIFENVQLSSQMPRDTLAALFPPSAEVNFPSGCRPTDLERELDELGFGGLIPPTTPEDKLLEQIAYLQNFEEGDFGMAGFQAFYEKEVMPLVEKEDSGTLERVTQLSKDNPEAYRKKCREEWLARKEADRLAAQESTSMPPFQPLPVNGVVGVDIAQLRPPRSTAIDPGIVINWKAVIQMTAGLPKEVKWIRERTCRVLYKLQELEKGMRYSVSEYRKAADSLVASIDAYNAMIDTPVTNKKALDDAIDVYSKVRVELAEDLASLRRGCQNLDVFREKVAALKLEFANHELADLVLCYANVVDANEVERRAIKYEKEDVKRARAEEAQAARQMQMDNGAQPSKDKCSDVWTQLRLIGDELCIS